MKKIVLIVQVLLVIGLITGAIMNRTNSRTLPLIQHDGSLATAQKIWTPGLNMSEEFQAPHDALPDLVVKSMAYRPASPYVGDPYVYFDVVIRNQGTARAYLKNMKLSLYKNTLGNLVGEMTWGATSPEFLEPGQEKTIRDFTTTDHSDLTKSAGAFKVIAFVDSKNVIPESNEGNNQFSKPITIAAKQPDLMIKSLNFRPASPSVGDAYVYFDVVIKNQGAARANFKNMDLSIYKNALSNYVGGLSWGTTSPEFLDPGQEKTFRNFNTTQHSDLTKTAGTFTVIAFVDSKNVIPESNEGNNQFSKPITIAAKLPDLVVTDITWTPNPTSYTSFTVNVKNQGSGDAGAFVVTLTTGGQTRTANAGKLTAGQSLALSLTPAVRYTSTGNYPVQATIDSKKQVAESNEGNNALSETLTIPVAPPQVVYLGMNRTLTPPFHFGETGGGGLFKFGGSVTDAASGKAQSHVEVVGSSIKPPEPKVWSSEYWAKVGETFRVEQGSYPNTSCDATIILNYHWNGYLSVVSVGGRSEAWLYGFASGLSSESPLQHWLKEWDGIESPVGSDRASLYHGPLAKGGSYTAYIRIRSYGLVTLGTVITDFYARNRGAFLDSIEIVFE